MPAWLEQTFGAIISLSILLDVFLTVLYARMGYSIFADHLARYLWKTICWASRPFGKYRSLALSFGGPVIVVVVVAFWVCALIVGQALIFHPALGTAVTASVGPTPRGFVVAIFAAGSSIVMPGAGTMQPNDSVFRIMYLFDGVTGLSILTLTLTYIMEIYSALHDRNTLALKLYLLTRRTGDAAELVAGLGAGGDFSVSYSMVAEAAAEIASLKESHNFYPVLFYFRFRAPYYSVSMLSNIALDAATLLSTALDEHKYGWLAESGAVVALKESAALLVDTLQQTFIPETSAKARQVDERRMEAWRRRYANALVRLQRTGIETRIDRSAGADAYIAMRRDWDAFIRTLAPSMGYDLAEIDPALASL